MAVVIPYTKQTWTDGVSACSAARNNVHEDGIFNAHNAPAVRVFHNANQAIVTATETTLAFNSERFDQAGGASAAHHDTVTNNSRLVCLYAGIYLIGATIMWEALAGGTFRQVLFRLNGATNICDDLLPEGGEANHRQAPSTLYSLAINDYVECRVTHDAGANRNVLVAGNSSPEFWMVRVG